MQHDRPWRGKGPYLDLRTEKGPAFNYSGIYSANMYTERAINVLREHAEKQSDTPLFMYLAYQSVHTPLEVPDHYMKPYESVGVSVKLDLFFFSLIRILLLPQLRLRLYLIFLNHPLFKLFG